jgi:hypothetical protein
VFFLPHSLLFVPLFEPVIYTNDQPIYTTNLGRYFVNLCGSSLHRGRFFLLLENA